ncbi:MAG: L-seryl-tRNA(Sec) selenium transferase [Candidatus Eremiobacteraeota bacterium]|nr:L-seryl-tRNA(Sec) selenium transferase [Candidatus Eremiobacteraeota bacterium]
MHRFLSDPRIAPFEITLGRQNVKSVVFWALERARSDGAVNDFEALNTAIVRQLKQIATEALRPVINATGVLLHTNLGRAPISCDALSSSARIASQYSNLEYDLAHGTRGSRYSRLGHVLRELTGAEDSLVVNNCAAAIVLMLDTFARNRDVVIARNELIEIGGEFRLPEIFTRSGARVVDVGTTNKVHVRDYEAALTANTALIFRSHFSNFRLSGFTKRVSVAELTRLGRRVGIPVVEDLGSGALVAFERFGLPHERTAAEAVTDGVDLVAFSGDKLLGGPQAGIIVGKPAPVARLRANPLIRALRVDKVTIALLEGTLAQYRSEDELKKIPLFSMLSRPLEAMRSRGERYRAVVPSAEIVDTTGYVGGGTFPESPISSVAVVLFDPAGKLERALRAWTPPIVGRLEDGRLWLDLRTIADEDDETVIEALHASL